MSSSCLYCSLLPFFLPSLSFFLVSSHLLTGNPSSPVCFSTCCVSRRLHGGQTSWWSMQRTSWPFMPLTWMPLWRSSPPRAGTASPSSSCSTTSSEWTVSSCPHIYFLKMILVFYARTKTLTPFCHCLSFRTDHLCNGKFHKHLQDLYAPLVVRYVDLMESSIAQSIHKGFDRESWEPVK